NDRSHFGSHFQFRIFGGSDEGHLFCRSLIMKMIIITSIIGPKTAARAIQLIIDNPKQAAGSRKKHKIKYTIANHLYLAV
ncbi:MAG: hypothetical protein AB2693_34845, partial [Candidatus Thiodiazotropha sp.]